MKVWYAAAGIAAGILGIVLLRRQSRGESRMKKAGKMLAVLILGRGLIMNLVTRLAKKTIQLQACRIRSAVARSGGIRGAVSGLREKAGSAVSAAANEAHEASAAKA